MENYAGDGLSCLFNSVYLCYEVDHMLKGLEPAPIFHQVIPKVFINNTKKVGNKKTAVSLILDHF